MLGGNITLSIILLDSLGDEFKIVNSCGKKTIFVRFVYCIHMELCKLHTFIFQDSEARIFVLAMSSQMARQLVCKVLLLLE